HASRFSTRCRASVRPGNARSYSTSVPLNGCSRPRRTSSRAFQACRRRPAARSTRPCTKQDGPEIADPAVEARPERRPVGPAAAFRLIASRNFGPYFFGNALSASGTWFQNLAAQLLVFRLTHSALLLGVLNFAQFAPMLLLAPWTGAAADRFDRRRLLLVTQPVAAVLSGTLALLTQLGVVSAGLVIGFGIGIGLTSAFSTPAQQALVVSLVPREDIPAAVALNSMTFNLARALGPAAAAAAVAAFGIPIAFALNSASFLIFFGTLLAVRQHRQERAESSRLRESIRLVARDRRLAISLAIVAIVGFASDPVNTLAP